MSDLQKFEPQQTALARVETSRAVAEVQARLIMAHQMPRDQVRCVDAIVQACTRQSLAEQGLYSYSKGGTAITGPSIRAAEAIAQLWGNIDFGFKELEQKDGASTVETFAWDLETNVRQTKTFVVRHTRHTRNGDYDLTDPREIYELVANQSARRLRACILGIIPGDVVEAAVKQIEATLATKSEVTPERLASLVAKFGEYGVTKEQIEKRIQRRLDAITPALLVNLGKIYNSLRDGMSGPGDWFEVVDGAPAVNPKHQPATALKDALKKTDKFIEEVDDATDQIVGKKDSEEVKKKVDEVVDKVVDLAKDIFGVDKPPRFETVEESAHPQLVAKKEVKLYDQVLALATSLGSDGLETACKAIGITVADVTRDCKKLVELKGQLEKMSKK